MRTSVAIIERKRLGWFAQGLARSPVWMLQSDDRSNRAPLNSLHDKDGQRNCCHSALGNLTLPIGPTTWGISAQIARQTPEPRHSATNRLDRCAKRRQHQLVGVLLGQCRLRHKDLMLHDFFKTNAQSRFLSENEARFPIPAWDRDRLPNRRWVLRHAKTYGVGVEIGVFRGQFSALICEIAKPKELYLVDPWTTLGETFGWGKEYTSFDRLTTLSARQEAIARVAAFPEVTCHIIEGSYPTCRDRLPEQLSGKRSFCILCQRNMAPQEGRGQGAGIRPLSKGLPCRMGHSA